MVLCGSLALRSSTGGSGVYLVHAVGRGGRVLGLLGDLVGDACEETC